MLIDIYKNHCKTPSDIQEHLPVLLNYSLKCESVVELGIRNGLSTVALLCGGPKKMTSYDIVITQQAKDIERHALLENIDFEVLDRDSIKVEIHECDLLFIDTLHTSSQLWCELVRHCDKVRKYIILHDTVTYALFGGGENGIIEGYHGLMFALINFLDRHQEWKVKEHFTNNNGLTVLERCTK